jgi:hypothetical protein
MHFLQSHALLVNFLTVATASQRRLLDILCLYLHRNVCWVGNDREIAFRMITTNIYYFLQNCKQHFKAHPIAHNLSH